MISTVHSLFITHYSLLKLFTGFAIAAFIAWKLIVIIVMNNATTALIIKTPAPI